MIRKPISVAVFGAGAFGSNHLRVYRELEKVGGEVHLAAVVDANPAKQETLREQWKVPVFSSAEACLAARGAGELSLDAVSVCVPTSAHHAVASQALAAGLDLLVEKPIASSLAEADDLIRQAAKGHRILQVGHLERFNPAVAAAAPLLNGPMFFEAHRLSVFHQRAMDVDVVLDLMIHDLDIVLCFARSELREVHAVGLTILSPKVDIANVRLEFASGCVANFTASRVSTEKVRKLRFFQPHQYLSIDYARQDLLIINVAQGGTGVVPSGAHATGEVNFNPSSGIALMPSKPQIVTGEPLLLEIKAFLEAVSTRSQPQVDGQQARDALALALKINDEIRAHAARAGLDRFQR